MSKQLKFPKVIDDILDNYIQRPVGQTCSLLAASIGTIVDSKPIRYLQRKVNPDLILDEYLPPKERFMKIYNGGLYAFGMNKSP